MRIVAGRFRGRALAGLGRGDAGAQLRPTTDRTRESLFNMLGGGRFGDPVTGARVLDLFAGTGALGLEALSRGAAHASFVENGRIAGRLLSENVRLLDLTGETRIWRCDARRLPPAPGPCDLILLDPPYGRGLGEAALSSALGQGWIAPGALVVWEESAPVVPPPALVPLDARRYGSTTITLLRHGPLAPA